MTVRSLALWCALCVSAARGEAPVLDTGVSAPADLDGDGLTDDVDPCPAACDCDGDGLSDPLELGQTPSVPTTALQTCTLALVDGDPATTTDPRRRDTDGGGLDDGQEDLDRDGVLDLLETDPSAVSDDLDRDGDGWPDALEPAVDPDGDGTDCGLDDDSDGDGLRDRDEPRRFALDGVTPTLLAPDSDGDGLSDGLDGLSDPDGDAAPAMLDPDSDGDGIVDGDEGALDLDVDGKPNFLDTNSDGDRQTDAAEAGTDLDCDGVAGPFDADDQSGFCAPPPAGIVDTGAFGAPFGPPTPPAPSAGCSVLDPSSLGWLAGLVWVPMARRRRR